VPPQRECNRRARKSAELRISPGEGLAEKDLTDREISKEYKATHEKQLRKISHG
jgi:hypothetical protein